MKKILLTFIAFIFICGINTVNAQDYIAGGTFEDTGSYVYGTGSHTDKIVSVANCSIKALWPQHSRITGYSEDCFSGTKSLHINQTGRYYPVTFIADLERGGVYKFSARVKLTDDSVQTTGNIFATTKSSDMSYGKNVMVLKDGEPGNLYTAENVTSQAWSLDRMTFSKDKWMLFERIIYVAPSETETTPLRAYVGIAHLSNTAFDYYIDDVSLTEVDRTITIAEGYDKVYAVKNESKKYSYKAESYFFLQENINWTVDGATDGVSIDQNGILTVEEGASGNINVIASTLDITGETVMCSKEVEIVPFTEYDMTVNINGESLDSFSANNENYIYEYRGIDEPKVEVTQDNDIEKNGNTVFVSNSTKTYDIILKKLPEYSENLYYDGGFEEGVIDDASMSLETRSGTLGITKEDVHNGRYALKIGANQYTTLALEADVKCGKMYMVSMWIKNSPDSAWNKFFPCFYTDDDATIQYYYESGKYFINGGLFASGNNNRCVTVTDEWQRIDRLIRISGDANDVKLKFGFGIFYGTAEYYVDDVSLYEIDLIQTNDINIGAVYKNSNGEIVTGINNADYVEVFLYNPQRRALDLKIFAAEYMDERLSHIQMEMINSTDLVGIIRKKLNLSEGTDGISLFVWNVNNSPYIEPIQLKGDKQ